MDMARRAGLLVDRRAVQRRPLAVGPHGAVGNQNVCVDLWVASTAGAVLKRHPDQTRAPLQLALGPHADQARLLVEVAHRLGHAGALRTQHGAWARVSPNANSTDADLGTENIRSNPSTSGARPGGRGSASLVRGSWRSSSRVSASSATSRRAQAQQGLRPSTGPPPRGRPGSSPQRRC
jgi:hypothetical protein